MTIYNISFGCLFDRYIPHDAEMDLYARVTGCATMKPSGNTVYARFSSFSIETWGRFDDIEFERKTFVFDVLDYEPSFMMGGRLLYAHDDAGDLIVDDDGKPVVGAADLSTTHGVNRDWKFAKYTGPEFVGFHAPCGALLIYDHLILSPPFSRWPTTYEPFDWNFDETLCSKPFYIIDANGNSGNLGTLYKQTVLSRPGVMWTLQYMSWCCHDIGESNYANYA